MHCRPWETIVMLDLNDLYYFSVVVEKRGFSAAA